MSLRPLPRQSPRPSLADLTNADAVSGLKQALDGRFREQAVKLLGEENGFFGNAKVKIPLPPILQKVESAMRMMGMKKQADELVLSMNRAAEAAVPEAKQLLVDAIKKMSVQDAKGILTGGDTAATEYFKRTTQAQLTAALPADRQKSHRQRRPRAAIQLARRPGRCAGAGEAGSGHDGNAMSRSKALDGLYLMIAEQEKASARIRSAPPATSSRKCSARCVDHDDI